MPIAVYLFLFFLYLTHALLVFSETSATLNAYSTSTAISDLSCYLILLHAQHTLHSRVKDSITQNLTIILSSHFLGRLISRVNNREAFLLLLMCIM